jgi:hypothetical protein
VQLPRIPVVVGRWGLVPRPQVMKNMYDESVVTRPTNKAAITNVLYMI